MIGGVQHKGCPDPPGGPKQWRTQRDTCMTPDQLKEWGTSIDHLKPPNGSIYRVNPNNCGDGRVGPDINKACPNGLYGRHVAKYKDYLEPKFKVALNECTRNPTKTNIEAAQHLLNQTKAARDLSSKNIWKPSNPKHKGNWNGHAKATAVHITNFNTQCKPLIKKRVTTTSLAATHNPGGSVSTSQTPLSKKTTELFHNGINRTIKENNKLDFYETMGKSVSLQTGNSKKTRKPKRKASKKPKRKAARKSSKKTNRKSSY